ncbi:MAG: DNA gyrase inhibitor YacG [Desulfuromonas sp.]|nr:MAG: DNA gyrase inhibitor YacG [Desulfuromonas sp.]
MVEKTTIIRCPQCREQVTWGDNPCRPFCSERCKLVDLGQWADEGYRIAGQSVDPEEVGNLISLQSRTDNP